MTLEDQMICGALQTLNEEACEDVMEETEVPDPEIPQTSVIPPSPENTAFTGDLHPPFRGSSDSGTFKSCFSLKRDSGDARKPFPVINDTKTDSTILILEPQLSGSNVSGSSSSFP